MTNEHLRELAGRLEKLTKPDREVDYALAEMAMPFLLEYRREPGDNGYYSDTPLIDGANKIAPASCYTGSIDEALGLVEQLLPGTEYEMTNLYGVAHVTLPLNDTEGNYETGRHAGGVLPIAICLALVRALAHP